MSARTRGADTPLVPRASQAPEAAPRAPGTPATEPGARPPTDRLVLAARHPTGSRRGPHRCPPAEGTGARHMSDTITRTRRDGGFPATTSTAIVPSMAINVIGRFEVTVDQEPQKVVGNLQRLLLALLILRAPDRK